MKECKTEHMHLHLRGRLSERVLTGKSVRSVEEKVYYQQLLKLQYFKHSMLPLETTQTYIKVLCKIKPKIQANASIKSRSLITHCHLSSGQGFENGVWGEYEGRDYCFYSFFIPTCKSYYLKKISAQIM